MGDDDAGAGICDARLVMRFVDPGGFLAVYDLLGVGIPPVGVVRVVLDDVAE